MEHRLPERPCGDLREVMAIVERLARDREAMNGDIRYIRAEFSSLHKRVSDESLAREKQLAAISWKILLAVFSAGLGLGSAVFMAAIKGP